MLDEGFCDLSGGNGYDRLFITIFERDPRLGGFVGFDTQFNGIWPFDQYQPMKMTQLSDEWIALTISPSDFGSSNEIYLVEDTGGYSIATTQPGPEKSWFLLERF